MAMISIQSSSRPPLFVGLGRISLMEYRTRSDLHPVFDAACRESRQNATTIRLSSFAHVACSRTCAIAVILLTLVSSSAAEALTVLQPASRPTTHSVKTHEPIPPDLSGGEPNASENHSTSKGSSPCKAFEKKAAAAVSPEARTGAYLSAARCVIVRMCAAGLSHELAGLSYDKERLTDLLDRGFSYLNSASETIQHNRKTMHKDIRQALEGRLDMLRAFGQAFAALAKADGTEAAKSRLTNACIGLATYVDDPAPGIVASATLWQGVAYRRAGRPDRALQVLWPTTFSTSSGRIMFFMRAERCRALADQGYFVAAISLAMKLGIRAKAWLKQEDASARKQAADSVRWLRVEIMRRWADSLRGDGHLTQAKAAEAQAAKILGQDAYPPSPDRWLPLLETIDGLPDWKEPPAMPSMRDADPPG